MEKQKDKAKQTPSCFMIQGKWLGREYKQYFRNTEKEFLKCWGDVKGSGSYEDITVYELFPYVQKHELE